MGVRHWIRQRLCGVGNDDVSCPRHVDCRAAIQFCDFWPDAIEVVAPAASQIDVDSFAQVTGLLSRFSFCGFSHMLPLNQFGTDKDYSKKTPDT